MNVLFRNRINNFRSLPLKNICNHIIINSVKFKRINFFKPVFKEIFYCYCNKIFTQIKLVGFCFLNFGSIGVNEFNGFLAAIGFITDFFHDEFVQDISLIRSCLFYFNKIINMSLLFLYGLNATLHFFYQRINYHVL